MFAAGASVQLPAHALWVGLIPVLGAMVQHCSVNEVLKSLDRFDGQAANIEGILHAQPEGFQILHYPKAERGVSIETEGDPYQSAVWLAFGSGALQPNLTTLGRWQGKRVRVQGFVRTRASLPPRGGLGRGGFGPYGLWPAQVEPYTIQRVTAGERREDGA